jgi:adrenodoxin-NADP+ reductase
MERAKASRLVADATQNCQHKFDELASDPRFTFLGNVRVGPSPAREPDAAGQVPSYAYPHAVTLELPALLAHYNAVVFAYGASLSNPLGVPSSSGSAEALGNVVPALALVSWYNGHPAYADFKLDLSGIREVDVVGQGNVALDVARILLRDPATLAESDLPQSVLDALATSSVNEVRTVGRRGPGQVAFTTKELREMVTLGVNYAGVDASLMAAAKEGAAGDRMRTRMLTLMDKPVSGSGALADKTFVLDFLRSPRRFIAREGESRVGSVEWDINALEFTPAEDGGKPSARAVRTGETLTRATDLVVESVGYRSEPISDLPFDLGRGRVSNVGGRVVDAAGPVAGAYASGWVARGPVGVIASTMQDAYGLVETLLSDYSTWKDGRGAGAVPLQPELGRPDVIERGLKEGTVVDMTAWLKIDAAEREKGKARGRAEREKFATVEEMLAVL